MSAQGLEVIDHTVHLTHEWINELAGRLDWVSKRSTLHLLRSTLHQLRDHMTVNELAQFSAQLPLLMRGMFYESWVPKNTPLKERGRSAFAEVMAAEMEDVNEYRGTEDVTYVFHLLNNRISAGEVQDVRSNLPAAITELWPAP